MLITFLSDFGLTDEWVASCKGVIKSIAPEVEVIDISHNVDSFDLYKGALILSRAVKTFNPAVHLAVVDPGVGTTRKAIAIATDAGHYLVGPNNGILSLAFRELSFKEAAEITNEDIYRKPVSPTFHARDIFAPAAAYLALGKPLSFLGSPLKKEEIIQLPLEYANFVDDILHTHVIEIDKFGSLRLNVKATQIKGWVKPGQKIKAKGPHLDTQLPFVINFADVNPNQAGLIVDSSELLTIFVNKGSAAEKFKLGVGTEVNLG